MEKQEKYAGVDDRAPAEPGGLGRGADREGGVMTGKLKLSAAWSARLQLRAEGNKLWAESDKLRAEGNILWAEGNKLWAEGNKLRAEGNKLWAEGNKLRAEGNILWAESDKLRAEGDKLWAEGNKLRAEGDKLWAEAIIEVYGNILIYWSWSIDHGDCTLKNGDRYCDDQEIEVA